MRGWAVINTTFGGGAPSEMRKMSLEEFSDWYQTACQMRRTTDGKA